MVPAALKPEQANFRHRLQESPNRFLQVRATIPSESFNFCGHLTNIGPSSQRIHRRPRKCKINPIEQHCLHAEEGYVQPRQGHILGFPSNLLAPLALQQPLSKPWQSTCLISHATYAYTRVTSICVLGGSEALVPTTYARAQVALFA